MSEQIPADLLKKRKRTTFILISVIVLAGIAFMLWRTGLFESKDKLPIVKQVPAFTLQNLQGESVKFQDLNGKTRLVEFFFTNCPDVCPITTYNMAIVQDRLKENNLFGDKVQFVSITFDPEYDTPEVLLDYADFHRMDQSGWTLLRGTDEDTEHAAQAFGVAYRNLGEGNVIHSVYGVFLVDGSGNIRKIYEMGDVMDLDQLYDDIVSITKI